MTHRFIVPGDALSGERVRFGPEQARQMSTVLRLGAGARVLALAQGEEVEVRLDEIGPTGAVGTIVARRPAAAEPRVELTLALPILRGARSEEIVEAATQLGVARFVPLLSARSVARALPEARRARWARIAREAAETAHRAGAPGIDAARSWPELFDALPAPVYVAWEEQREPRLLVALEPGCERLSLVVGPEGGLTEAEVALARERGATIVSLGRRTLRAETAAIAAVAQIMAALD
jgi:16S rRNA (uracil1498-N3)-methyltransferase